MTCAVRTGPYAHMEDGALWERLAHVSAWLDAKHPVALPALREYYEQQEPKLEREINRRNLVPRWYAPLASSPDQ
jgi:hypothetical protein